MRPPQANPAVTKKGRTKKKQQKASSKSPGRGSSRKPKRAASQATVDDLAIISIAIQHQRTDEATNRILSLSYCVRKNGKRTGGYLDLDGENPLTLGKLIGKILDSSKNVVFANYPDLFYVMSSQTDVLFEWLEDGAQQREDLTQKGRTFFSRTSPLKVRHPIASGKNYRDDHFWFVDSRNLGPNQDGIAELEAWFGRQPSGSPSEGDWESGYASDREQHTESAKAAAELLADFAYEVAKVTFACTDTAIIYSTRGTLAEEFFITEVSKSQVDLSQLLGKESITTENGTCGAALIRRLHLRETLAAECFHGGRNESFAFGPTKSDEWVDYDLRSAYPTALASVGMPQWENGFETTKLSDFTDQALGFALVSFEFPASTRFPTMPVRAPGKLIFPLSGDSYATAPEIALARSLGATITIRDGFVIPCNQANKPYLPIIRKSLEHRKIAENAGNDLHAKLHKAIANAIPGRMGQGLPPKRESVEQSRKVPPSRITQAFLAAHVNGLVRAAMGEILNRLPESATVVSVTTDGFITNRGYSSAEKACTGPLCQLLSDTRKALTADPSILSTKGKAKRLLPIRNRIIATITPKNGARLILSRSGIQPPPERRTPEQKNQWLLERFIKRTPSLRLRQDSWRQSSNTAPTPLQVGLEYDFDRRLTYDREESLCGKKHGSFSTRPWNSLEDYLLASTAFSEFRKSSCLRGASDLQDFEDRMKIHHARKLSSTVIFKDPAQVLKRAKRVFLRALLRGDLGLAPYQNLPRKDLAERINRALAGSSYKKEIETKLDDFKNANRPKSAYEAGSLPKTQAIVDFLTRMTTEFPGFTMEELHSRDPKSLINP
jgi:hypothetical protein